MEAGRFWGLTGWFFGIEMVVCECGVSRKARPQRSKPKACDWRRMVLGFDWVVFWSGKGGFRVRGEPQGSPSAEADRPEGAVLAEQIFDLRPRLCLASKPKVCDWKYGKIRGDEAGQG